MFGRLIEPPNERTISTYCSCSSPTFSMSRSAVGWLASCSFAAAIWGKKACKRDRTAAAEERVPRVSWSDASLAADVTKDARSEGGPT